MNEMDLLTKIEGLEKAIAEHKDFAGTYEGELTKAKQQLADYNKPELTPEQFGDLENAVQSAVEAFDFSNTDMYEMEFSIDYDNRIECSHLEFRDHYELTDMLVKKVTELFAEATCPEDEEPTNEQLEQPVESQSVKEEVLLDPMPPAEPCESEVTHSKPSTEDMESLKKMAEEKKQNKEEKTFKKRTWF